MKKLIVLLFVLFTNAVRSQSIENADICLIWMADLKPYQTFQMSEDENILYKKLSKNFPNPQNPHIFVQGIFTSLNSDEKPIYVVVYTTGKKGYENVNILEYSEFIEFTED